MAQKLQYLLRQQLHRQQLHRRQHLQNLLQLLLKMILRRGFVNGLLQEAASKKC
jgi:hypothetical protein